MPRDWRSEEEKRHDEATAWRFKLDAGFLALMMALPYAIMLIDWL